MKRLICGLFGHRNILYLTVRPMALGVVIGGACLRCHTTHVSDTAIGHLIWNENENEGD